MRKTYKYRLYPTKRQEAGCRFIRVDPQYTSVICSGCGAAVPKTLAVRVHRCPACGLVIGRDHNAAINILQKATAGTAGIYAWGEFGAVRPLVEPGSPFRKGGVVHQTLKKIKAKHVSYH